MVTRIGQTNPVHLDARAQIGQVQQMPVIVLAGRSHVDVERAVYVNLGLAPDELEVRPAHVHLLSRVVGVEAGVEQKAVGPGRQQEAAMKKEADLVPPGQRRAGVLAVPGQQVEGQGALRWKLSRRNFLLVI